LHELLIERANSDYRKRLQDKQKRFGKVHDIDEEMRERAITALKNRNEMSRLMQQYGLLIPARSLPLWRPTERIKGDIAGVRESIVLIATDGVLGWFLTYDSEEPWCGHIQCFSEVNNIRPLFSFEGPMASKTKVKKVKPKTKRQLFLESI
jgi:hypothetical protein